jgi:hypothetical protein
MLSEIDDAAEQIEDDRVVVVGEDPPTLARPGLVAARLESHRLFWPSRFVRSRSQPFRPGRGSKWGVSAESAPDRSIVRCVREIRTTA